MLNTLSQLGFLLVAVLLWLNKLAMELLGLICSGLVQLQIGRYQFEFHHLIRSAIRTWGLNLQLFLQR